MPGRLNWNGDDISKRVLNAMRRAADESMAAAIPVAKARTPVVTGTAQGSIRLEPARIFRDEVRGRWGSFDVNYFIFLETGARGRPGLNMLRGAQAQEMTQEKVAERIAFWYRAG